MDIYNYFIAPQMLNGYKDRINFVPEAALHKCLEFDSPIKELEPVILKTPSTILTYTKEVLDRRRWPEGEKALLKIGQLWALLEYARDIIRGKWSEAEPIILKDSAFAASYAINILDTRWPEAEPIILNDVGWAIEYAFYIIKGEWPELEEKIKNDAASWKIYLRNLHHLDRQRRALEH